MNYTINQLRIFVKVAECKSVTKAADELALTQPAVSIQLKNFQDQFNIPLTQVVGRTLHITDFGKEIAVISQRALDELDALKYKTNEFNGLLSGSLKISSASTGKYVVPYFLTDFLDQHHGIDLKLDVTNKTEVLKSLRDNEIEFAIVSILPDEMEVEEEVLIENQLFLVGSTKMTWDKPPIIFREKGSATRQVMESYFTEKKRLARKKLELTSNEAVKQAVVAGLGVSILPLIGIRNELLNKSISIIPRKDLPIRTHWRLIWLRSKKLSPVASAFLEFVQANKHEIIDKYFKWYEDYS